MRERRLAPGRSLVIAAVVAAATVGGALARQDPPAAGKQANPAPANNKTKTKKGGLLAPGGGKAKALRKDAADPFGKRADPATPTPEPGTYHYTFKINVPESGPVAATYYPSRLGTGSAVVLLVHERDRSSKDFEDKIADFGNISFAEGLQKQGYAVLAFDLRGHGGNPRRSLSQNDWKLMVGDLQYIYMFLIDRHNRGELNLSRLGVVGVGEGANLAAIWANLPGAAVSTQTKPAGDLGAIVLISPMVDSQSQGLRVQQAATALAPRLPMLVMAGERDTASADIVKAAKPAITRSRVNKVEFFPSSLHGFKLLRLEPNVASSIEKFFDVTIKARAEEWEPRYNLEPVPYGDVVMVLNPSAKAEAAKKAEDAK